MVLSFCESNEIRWTRGGDKISEVGGFIWFSGERMIRDYRRNLLLIDLWKECVFRPGFMADDCSSLCDE